MNQNSSIHCLVAWVMFVNLNLKVYDSVYAAGLQVFDVKEVKGQICF